ncbi:MAG: sigma-70 family RNA polymerase sigma factor [Methyloglobulus sp.]|nr:sigma-70 family RNA polymerase sigma factor [Methyloglobulus sp.]
MNGQPTFPLDIEALFGAHQRELVWHLTKIVKCEETAAELAQESYLILSQAAKQETIKQPRGFLFRVASNLAFSHLRRHKLVEAKLPYLSPDELHFPSAEQHAAQEQRLEYFVKAVETLPPRTQEIFILHKVEGISVKEVADRLGITAKAVEKQITRGLAHCRSYMKPLDSE